MMPCKETLTYEGVFYQHYFAVTPTDSDVVAVRLNGSSSADPLNPELTDHFLSVGIASKYDGSGLSRFGGRPPVELIFVLDVSGSMVGTFPVKQEKPGGLLTIADAAGVSKMEAAKEALSGLLDQLKEGDAFGLVTFNGTAKTIVPLQAWDDSHKESIRKVITGLSANGGTNLSSGFVEAMEQYSSFTASPAALRRVFFLTDMNLNVGERNTDQVLSMFNDASALTRPVHATVIGFGIDFNAALMEALAGVPSCNYFTVFSAKDFLHQMTFEFDYLVFPVASDLTVETDDQAAVSTIAVCGAPVSPRKLSESTILYVNSVFPSQTMGRRQDETKGGIVIVKVRLTEPAKPLALRVSYTTFDGQRHSFVEQVDFAADLDQPQFERSGIRKGVLLARWTALMRAFLANANSTAEEPFSSEVNGIAFNLPATSAGRSTTMKEVYRPLFSKFLRHFEQEASLLEDDFSQWHSAMSKFMVKPDEVKAE